jgi:hypothetical protein
LATGAARGADPLRRRGIVAVIPQLGETERHGKVELKRRHHLSSAKPDREIFARAARGHRGSRTGCAGPWTRCPATTLRSGHGPEGVAVVKHMALNPLRRAVPSTGLKNRRKLAGWASLASTASSSTPRKSVHPIALPA